MLLIAFIEKLEIKCLLCNFESNDMEDLKKHYIDFHNNDQNNRFFIELFKKLFNYLNCLLFHTSCWQCY